MKNYTQLILVVLLTCILTNVKAQIDTVFWFAAPEVSASSGDNPILLNFLTYDNPADVNISLPANGSFTPININIPANTNSTVDLTPFLASIESPAADVISNNGIKITSTNQISAYYELNNSSNKEFFSLKGNKALGTNFYTPFHTFWNNSATSPASFSSIDIVASEDNTTVLITPRTAITGHAQDVTFIVNLNEGETYSARDMNVTAASTLAGSIVASDKPIAVTIFSGALTNSTCQTSLGDQLTSTTYTGEDYIVHKGTGDHDRVYILGIENGTSITINNTTTTSALINSGETYELILSDTFNYISCSKPVYTTHISGYGCELSMAQVPNLFCAGTYETAFTRSSSDSLGLTLYTRTGFENQFELNGNASLIPAGAFSDVPGTSGEYKVAQLHFNTTDVPVGSYNKVTNSGDIFGLGILSGNNSSGSAYGYLSEFSSYPFVNAGNNAIICANTSIPLNGLVGGGTVTGVWSNTGFGTFSSPANNLLNEYIPDPLDTLLSSIKLILTSTGVCPIKKDTLLLTVEPAPIVSASADQSVCENASLTDLNGSVIGGATTGQWSTLGTGIFNPDNTTLNAVYEPSPLDLSNGSVQLVLTSTNFGSCLPETDTMEIVFTPPPAVDAGLDTINVCENNPIINLNGNVSGATTTGKWTSSGNGNFIPDNLTLNATYNPSPLDISNGSILLYLESTSNNNCSIEYDSVVINFTQSPTVEAGANLLVCKNDSTFDLSGVIGGSTTTGIWSGGAGVYSTSNTDLNSQYSPTSTEVSNGNLFLTLTSTNSPGCLDVSDNVQITFIDAPIANFIYTEECLYEEAVYTDNSFQGFGAIDNWQWDFGDNNNASTQNTAHLYATHGSYDVQLIVTSTYGCSDTVIKSVNVYEIPTSDFTYTASCPNNQVSISFTDQSTAIDSAIDSWFYDFGGQGDANIQNPTQAFAANGDYTITQIVGTGENCYDTSTQVISVPSLPIADFSFNTNNGLNIGAVFNFINTSSNSINYFWSFDTGAVSNLEDPSYTYFSNGSYTVSLIATGDLGCTDSASQLIQINTVTTEINTLIPNAISPNNDGKNDVWKLDFLNLLYPNARVSIYNEWGQLLFESQGAYEPWDGTFNDDLVPDGTYFYIIELNENSSSDEIFKGSILVLKSKD
ncbi:MAG: PKD domain-containing protein [Crocinitomicaceae bacterium]|nr:PKD domain-containing protein [Crocinitomicaceae bacterium]